MSSTEMNTEITIVTDGQKEKFSLVVKPKMDALRIREEEKNILKSLNLPSIIQNLNNAVSLLDIAYNAVSGSLTQVDIRKIQKQLQDVTTESLKAMQNYMGVSEKAIYSLNYIYKEMLKSHEDFVIEELEKLSQQACAMYKKAQELEKSFKNLHDNTENVLNSMLTDNAKKIEENSSLKIQVAEFQKESESLKIAQENLDRRLKAVTDEYQDMKEDAKNQEKRQNTFEILSVVFNFLGGAMSAAQQYAQQSSPQGGTGAPENKDKKNLEENKAAEQTLRSDLAEAEKTLKEIKDDLDDRQKKKAIETDRVKCEELQREIEAKQQERNVKQEEIDKLKEKLKDNQTQQEQLQKLCGAVSGQTQEYSKRAGESLGETRKMLKSIYSDMMELEKLKGENLASMAVCTQKIAGANMRVEQLEIAIQSMLLAISCMKQVSYVMEKMREFWGYIAVACQDLSTNSLGEHIERIRRLPDKEERIAEYQDDDIKLLLMGQVFQWAAIYRISDSYVKDVGEVQEKLDDKMGAEERSPEVQQKEAQIAARDIFDNLKEQREEGDSRRDELRKQFDQLGE